MTSETSDLDPSVDQSTTGRPIITNTEPHVSRSKTGIGGCLLYPLLFLIVQPLAFLSALTQRPYSPLPATYYIYWPNMILDVLIVCTTLILLVMFLRKKQILPALFIVALAILFAAATALSMFLPPPGGGATDPIRTLMVLFVQCFILIPYFVLSDRVKNTFVRDLDNSSAFEHLLMPLADPLGRFYGSLVKRRRWVFPIVLGYVIAVTGIGAVIGTLLGRHIF